MSGALRDREQTRAASGVLSRAELLVYGLPWLPIQMILLVITVYLPSYYAISVGLSMTVVGTMFFVARLWDVFTDTLIGGLSDTWRTRWGRRKPWVAAGTPMLMVSAAFLFMPPATSVSGAYLGIWLFLFYLAWSAVQIPYTAWGAELSTDYVERNRIVGVREALGTIGIMLGTGLPILFLRGADQNLRGVLRTALITNLLTLPPTVALSLSRVRRESVTGPGTHFGWRVILDVITRNPLFLRWSCAFLIWATAWNIFLASLVIIIEYMLGLRNQYLSLILVMNLAATAVMPIAIHIARRIDKHRMLAAGMCGFIVFYEVLSLMPPRQYWWTLVIFLALGLCWAPALATMSAMIPDIVDVGTFQQKRGEAGIYMAVFFLLQKLSQALGIGVGLPLLESIGFSLKSPDSEAGRHAIHVVSLHIPAVMTLASVWLLWTYPLTRERHAVIRRWFDRQGTRLG